MHGNHGRKHRKKGRLLGNIGNKNIIVIDSIDGAEHIKSKKMSHQLYHIQQCLFHQNGLRTKLFLLVPVLTA